MTVEEAVLPIEVPVTPEAAAAAAATGGLGVENEEEDNEVKT